MAKRKTPPRYKSGPKKGQFMPKSVRRRKARRNPVTASASTRTRRRSPAKRKAPTRRRSYRRNPPRRGDILDTFINGAMGAGGVLVGKAAVRSLPQLLSLPQAGNTGLAVQAATAVAAGWVADRFIGPDVASYILAGGLSAPMESLIIRLNVPWLSTALASSGAVAGYVQPRGIVAAPRMGLNGVRGYVSAPAVTAGGKAAGYSYYN